jgi:hypothetical protein
VAEFPIIMRHTNSSVCSAKREARVSLVLIYWTKWSETGKQKDLSKYKEQHQAFDDPLDVLFVSLEQCCPHRFACHRTFGVSGILAYTSQIYFKRMCRFSLAACVLLVGQANAFFPPSLGTTPTQQQRITQLLMVISPPDAPAGSFFNPVPDDDENKKDDESLDIDKQVTELLRNRKKPAMASQPSTINGVPTENATGKDKDIFLWKRDKLL